jgi:iron complex transport system substrate-binding protein
MVGRSHECDFPPSIAHLPVLTSQVHEFETSRQMHQAVSSQMREAQGNGLYSIDSQLLNSLEPDLIITQSLCTVCSIDSVVVERIASKMARPPNILSLNPASVEDVIDDLEKIGRAVGMEEQGKAAAQGLRLRLKTAQELVTGLNAKVERVAFLEWTDPIFPAGHWTPQLIEMAGGSHPLNPPIKGGAALPSKEISPSAVVDSNPDWVILCPCGLNVDMAIRESQGITSSVWWKGLRAVRENKVVVVDGNQYFNRPGPRLVDALEWLVSLLHDQPDVSPPGFQWTRWAQTPEAVSNLRVPSQVADIEELHHAACSNGKSSYVDPWSGYQVFTSSFLADRGQCCGNKCRHCPYAHFRVKSNRSNVPTKPILCDTKLLPRSFVPVLVSWPAGGHFPSREIEEVKKRQGRWPVLVGRIQLGLAHDETYLLDEGVLQGSVSLSQAFELSLKEGVPIIIIPQQENDPCDSLFEANKLLRKREIDLIETFTGF